LIYALLFPDLILRVMTPNGPLDHPTMPKGFNMFLDILLHPHHGVRGFPFGMAFFSSGLLQSKENAQRNAVCSSLLFFLPLIFHVDSRFGE